MLQMLTNEDRANIIKHLADLMVSRQKIIMDANRLDITNAEKNGKKLATVC